MKKFPDKLLMCRIICFNMIHFRHYRFLLTFFTDFFVTGLRFVTFVFCFLNAQ